MEDDEIGFERHLRSAGVVTSEQAWPRRIRWARLERRRHKKAMKFLLDLKATLPGPKFPKP